LDASGFLLKEAENAITADSTALQAVYMST
jgi:hypothetical protein